MVIRMIKVFILRVCNIIFIFFARFMHVDATRLQLKQNTPGNQMLLTTCLGCRCIHSKWHFVALHSRILRLHFLRHTFYTLVRVAVISAKNHKRQRRKRQSVTAKREKSQTPKVLTAILTLHNLT